ncbi:aspartate/glutamate racemase family protein [Microbacterium sp. NIBRBAC000506063]|uniref:aspartate/glutamate racemase family protein n=1 Tax=Microbacterium sp. NIBRBAC000506063 TaxID=2734618 RepID=UPI001BB708E8|nr:amino acid racemase [Microbacterium sp. NIBRBAC000506063]QTV79602.1 aspartate/glutamate racemase family protein [Microbacterium sp. NIBRBAC000506063]
MGPLATAYFYEALVRLTPASQDGDHIKTIIWSDPAVPDRTAYLTGSGISPLPRMLGGVHALSSLKVDVMAMPCNTAHAFLGELRGSTQALFVDMVSETVQATIRAYPECATIGVLGTRGTRAAGLYDAAAIGASLTVAYPSEADQTRLVDEAIRIVKAGGDLDLADRLLAAAAQNLKSSEVDVAIAACTELPLVMSRARSILPVMDSIECLAAACVREIRWVGRRVASGPSVED